MLRTVIACTSLVASVALVGATAAAPASALGSNPELVSTDANGRPSAEYVTSHSLSDDGNKVVYTTDYGKIWLRDRAARKSKVVFEDANLDGEWGSLSGNGRFLYVAAHECGCDNPTPAQSHNLVKDLNTGEIRELHTDLSDKQYLVFRAMTSDGRYAFFESQGVIYRWDTRTTSRLTRVVTGDHPAVSSDGRVIAYDSGQNIYVRTLPSGQPVLVNATPDGKPTTSDIKSAPDAVSDDGRFVLYSSAARNLDPHSGQCKDDYGVANCVYLRDLHKKASTLVSRLPDGTVVPANTGAMSNDGAQIAFQSNVEDSGGTADQIYQRSRTTGATRMVSANAKGEPADPWAGGPQMDARGDVVTFQSPATNFGVKTDQEQIWAVH